MAQPEIMSDAVIGPRFAAEDVCLRVRDLSVHYGDVMALDRIALRLPRRRVTAFIGPSGCGKTTLLRCFNRMNDLIEQARVDGGILFEGEDIYGPDVDPYTLRRRIGMVFQKPNPFPKSVYENVAFGLRLEGIDARAELDERVEWALRSAAIWDEVKDRLDAPALGLSGGQQQPRDRSGDRDPAERPVARRTRIIA